MSMYYVNYHGRDASVIDRDGLDLACIDEALRFVYDLIKELQDDDPIEAHWRNCRFEVTDESGAILLCLPVALVMAIIARQARHRFRQ